MKDNRTLLIVDDEPETLRGYEAFLSPQKAGQARKSSRSKDSGDTAQAAGPSEHFELLLADTGEKAIELARAHIASGREIAAGFFDVKLGAGIDGLTTIQEIRKLAPEIHCTIVTAYHDRNVEDIHKLFGESFKDHWDYLNKPFTQGEILQKARQMTAAWNRKRKIDTLNRQLVRSERLAAVGQVARGIGHEFGNILLRIVGKADLALMEKDPSKIPEHLKVILDAAERASVITRNLQSFSKSEPHFAPGSVETPLKQTISLVNHELIKASVKVVQNISPTPKIRLDSNALAQVFLNMVINAIHAMPTGGTITVTLKEQATAGIRGVLCTLRDTGQGIPAEVLPKIFEYAFSTKGEQGSGLGLAISKEIVDAHDGTISVTSEPAKGTEFTLWFPALEEAS